MTPALYSPANPVVDRANPLYCPAVPPAKYLKNIRQALARRAHQNPTPRSHIIEGFFAAVLADNEARVHASSFPSSSPSRESWIGPWDHPPSSNMPCKTLYGSSKLSKAKILTDTGRRRKLARAHRQDYIKTFGAEQNHRSSDHMEDSSFEVALRHETLQYPPLETIRESSPVPGTMEVDPVALKTVEEIEALRARLRLLEDEQYTFADDISLSELANRCNNLLPGLRIKDDILNLVSQTPQGVLNFLASRGLLRPPLLRLFSKCRIHDIWMSPSIRTEDGLNLNPLLGVFGEPDSFRCLQELSFANARLKSADLVHIQRLPNLSTLSLAQTGINDEAVFLLVPLKGSLTELSLMSNLDITDDAVPALVLLERLSYVSILATGIGMGGLRRLAQTISEELRVIDVEIPQACDEYVDSVHMRYLYTPSPPLITDPTLVPSMSVGALQRNLEAHHRVNSAIVPTGTKAEMIERLSRILKLREADVLVRGMLGMDSNEAFYEEVGEV